ncbi:MAG: glycosyltransferase family 2 protein [Ruminococcaceae bacterium]|nr:glycosyltransferase family 2 protein [Oscillospiraceae bacterium]
MSEQSKHPLISVIVPVYNVEKYLERCVKSILLQTYDRLEIILVNDGSKDGSGKLCDELAKGDPRIVVLHKENGGASSARNAGLDLAHGEYIGFVDSDDWIAPDMYEYCLRAIDAHDAQVVQTECALVRSEAEAVKQEPEQVEVYAGKDILQYYMLSTTRSGGYSVCRCLFARELLMGIRFREGKTCEDIDYKYKALARAEKMVVTNLKKYFYFQSVGSVSTSGLRAKNFDLYDAADELCKLTKDEPYGDIRRLGEIKKARTALAMLSQMAYFGISDPTLDKKTMVKRFTKEHRQNLKLLLGAPIPVSRKLLSVMFAINYQMTELAVKIAKKIF